MKTELEWLSETRDAVLHLMDYWENSHFDDDTGFCCMNSSVDPELSPVKKLCDVLHNENPVFHLLQTVNPSGEYEFPGIWLTSDLGICGRRVATSIELASQWADALDDWLSSLYKVLKTAPDLRSAYFSLESPSSPTGGYVFKRKDLELPSDSPTAIRLGPLRSHLEGYYKLPFREFAGFPVAIQREWSRVELEFSRLHGRLAVSVIDQPSPPQAVHAYFERLESLLQAAVHQPLDYRVWFQEKSTLTRQDRWQKLRAFREQSNTVRAELFHQQLDELAELWGTIDNYYWLAKPDLEQVNAPFNCGDHGWPVSIADDAVAVAPEILRRVIEWHNNDGGYWENFPEAESDSDAQVVREQLAESERLYPLTRARLEELLRALRKARGHLLRQVGLNQANTTTGSHKQPTDTGNVGKPRKHASTPEQSSPPDTPPVVGTRQAEELDDAPAIDDDQDDTEELLKGQALALFRFLRGKRHWVRFDTIWDCAEAFRVANPDDPTILKALERLNDRLCECGREGCPLWSVSIADRRAKLSRIR